MNKKLASLYYLTAAGFSVIFIKCSKAVFQEMWSGFAWLPRISVWELPLLAETKRMTMMMTRKVRNKLGGVL